MRSGNRGLVVALALLCAAASVQGQEKMTERTLKLGPGAKPPDATLADVAWLAGHWVGPALGGRPRRFGAHPTRVR